MRSLNKKNYRSPHAEITFFECADVITASRPLKEKPESSTGGSYVSVGSITWKDGFGQSD